MTIISAFLFQIIFNGGLNPAEEFAVEKRDYGGLQLHFRLCCAELNGKGTEVHKISKIKEA